MQVCRPKVTTAFSLTLARHRRFHWTSIRLSVTSSAATSAATSANPLPYPLPHPFICYASVAPSANPLPYPLLPLPIAPRLLASAPVCGAAGASAADRWYIPARCRRPGGRLSTRTRRRDAACGAGEYRLNGVRAAWGDYNTGRPCQNWLDSRVPFGIIPITKPELRISQKVLSGQHEYHE